jgi:hypothetical protein|tara:strand:- start:1226 stop:1507 length:282 start_codon:yes stop_codon:yes gene_type:complete
MVQVLIDLVSSDGYENRILKGDGCSGPSTVVDDGHLPEELTLPEARENHAFSEMLHGDLDGPAFDDERAITRFTLAKNLSALGELLGENVGAY